MDLSSSYVSRVFHFQSKCTTDSIMSSGLLNFSKTSIPLPAPRPPPITPKIVELPSLRPTTTPTPDDSPNIPAYQLLKLVCVKYLGIISFASPTRPLSPTIKAGIERVQDLIREKGGLGLLLGMCQIDGQNPSTFPFFPL